MNVINSHYKRLARLYGAGPKLSMEDPFIRAQETRFVKFALREALRRGDLRPIGKTYRVLDVGCGNGHLLSRLKADPYLANYPFEWVGMEYHPDLIKICHKREDCEGIQFAQGDMIYKKSFEQLGGRFSAIITERSLINVLARKNQYRALGNILGALGNGGLYVMIESFFESLDLLNRARREFALLGPEIKESEHNRYLRPGILKFIEKDGGHSLLSEKVRHHLSTYFYLTRVLHPALRARGTRVKQSFFVDFMKEALPTGVGTFSPIQFHLYSMQR